MSRIELLVYLQKLINMRSLDDDYRAMLVSKFDAFLDGKISQNDLTVFLSNEKPIVDYDEWVSIIKNKPIYRDLKLVKSGEMKDQCDIAKVASALVTQLLIRKKAKPEFNPDIVGMSEILDLLNKYSKSGFTVFDTESFITLISNYNFDERWW